MSFIPNFTEAQQWLSSWQAEIAEGRSRGARFIKQAAVEQRANLEAVKTTGYHSAINIPEYERSVLMIENAARSL